MDTGRILADGLLAFSGGWGVRNWLLPKILVSSTGSIIQTLKPLSCTTQQEQTSILFNWKSLLREVWSRGLTSCCWTSWQTEARWGEKTSGVSLTGRSLFQRLLNQGIDFEFFLPFYFFGESVRYKGGLWPPPPLALWGLILEGGGRDEWQAALEPVPATRSLPCWRGGSAGGWKFRIR